MATAGKMHFKTTLYSGSWGDDMTTIECKQQPKLNSLHKDRL